MRVVVDAHAADGIVLEQSIKPGSISGTRWEPVCSAPCTARIDETSALRIHGFGRSSRPFQLSSIYPRQRLDVRGRGGSVGGQIAGWSMVVASGALWGLGFMTTLDSVAQERRPSWWSAGMLVGAPVLGIAGRFVLANSYGKLTFSLHAASPRAQR